MKRPPLPTARRQVLATGLGLAACIFVRSVESAPDDLAHAIATFTKGAPVSQGRVTLNIAELVDNGNAVPLTVAVRSAMSAADHVTDIAIFNEKNPQREVATFKLGPRSGLATVSTRIRLASSQKLVGVARMSDGTFWSHTVEIEVTVAACIGSDSDG